MFLDRARVRVKAGDGGRGVISFRREAHVPRGGPDGGDGGHGGNVVLKVDEGLTTLSEFRFARTFSATSGAHGRGSDRRGGSGGDLVLAIPPGTVVTDLATGERVGDLVAPGQELIIARGGRGGRGNARFVSSTRRVPRIAEEGQPGEEREIELELKLIADVGLVGLPNAGKSSLLAAMTRARPKIADYPFTTLTPNLGVAGLEDREIVIADIPGLIEGAHRGVGLGEEFLRHVERTRLLVHVVDASRDDPLADIATVDAELAAYGRGLADRPRLYALNKTDLAEARDHLPALLGRLGDARGVSAASGEGVRELLALIFTRCPALPRVEPAAPGERRIAFAGGARDWSVAKEDGGYRVRGDRVERLAGGIDWESPDAAAYFQQTLQRSGIDRALRDAGAEEGDTIRIGKREFEWREGGR